MMGTFHRSRASSRGISEILDNTAAELVKQLTTGTIEVKDIELYNDIVHLVLELLHSEWWSRAWASLSVNSFLE
jgi:hypothetical protein